MKEATGELSVTVITIVAIAAISAIFVVFLLPTLKAQISLTQACNNGPGYTANNDDGFKTVSCGAASTTDGSWTCTAYDGKSASGKTIGTKTCTRK